MVQQVRETSERSRTVKATLASIPFHLVDFPSFLPRITHFFAKPEARRARRPHPCSPLLCLVNLFQVCLCDSDSSDSQPALHYLRRACVAASQVAWSGAHAQVFHRPVAAGCTTVVGPQLYQQRQENESTCSFFAMIV